MVRRRLVGLGWLTRKFVGYSGNLADLAVGSPQSAVGLWVVVSVLGN